jgi:Icc protein
MANRIIHAPTGDGIDRRGFLECMAWVGTGVVWTVSGGVLSSRTLGDDDAKAAKGDFSFVQISDSHIGFSKEPNKNVTATLEKAIAKINSLPQRPDLLIHTGDLTHLSKPDEFDTVSEILKGAKAGRTLYVPGEHDVFSDDGKQYLERHGKGTRILCDRSLSPWDDPQRRPSHADRRNALRRACLQELFSSCRLGLPTNRKSQGLVQALMKLVA